MYTNTDLIILTTNLSNYTYNTPVNEHIFSRQMMNKQVYFLFIFLFTIYLLLLLFCFFVVVVDAVVVF